MRNPSRKTTYNPITSKRVIFRETSKETIGKKKVIEIELSPKGQMNVKLDKKVITLSESEPCKIEIGKRKG